MIRIYQIIICLIFCCLGCSSNNNDNTSNPDVSPPTDSQNTISKIEFIDEYVIPVQNIAGVPVGGLSGIDYYDGKWYLICDTSEPPIRYYNASISYTSTGFTEVSVNTMTEIKDNMGAALAAGTVDPESIRFDPNTQNLVYSSEGSIVNDIDPALFEISTLGNLVRTFTLPDYFKAQANDDTKGPRHNGVFEGLSLNIDNTGYWVSTELPLIEDGPEPTLTDTDSPVRITFFNKNTGLAERQFTYELDPVARPATLGTTFEVNGLVEILEYDQNKFLALERSFSSGYIDGGNNVKIYKVDATEATNTLSTESLNSASYTKAQKTLLFDFETIRSQLINNSIDNIEGISFGPALEDGSRTIVVVSDNNFNSFIPQKNQLILFKVIP